jgi:hypothetical protein
VAVLVTAVLLLFAGRWVAAFLADRWWAAAVAPAAMPFIARWHLLALTLELGGLLVAGAWCVGHFLWVVRSIGAVQVPRRLGDLEIRELLPLGTLRTGAVVAGALLGVLLGAGAGAAAPLVAQAWQGVRFGIVDPVLGNDLGIYLVQLPLWEAALTFAGHLLWAALAGAALCHFVVGGMRITRTGAAMTESARRQLGLLLAGVLALSAMNEALGPLRAVAGLEGPALAALAPEARWSIAIAWGVAALLVAGWTLRPWPPLILFGLGLWLGTGLLSHLVAPNVVPHGTVSDARDHPIAARATGLDAMVEESAPLSTDPGPPPGPGLWSPEALVLLLQANGGQLLGSTPTLLEHAGTAVPAWLVVRTTREGPEVVAIADDRLSPGGASVSYREGDPADYPGVVSWRRLPASAVRPEMADTVATLAAGGIPLGGTGRRLLLAWGTQTVGALGRAPADAALWWRMSPRERAARLFPPAWWDAARPLVVDGRLLWLVDGWLTATGAALAPSIPWEGAERRYARPEFSALIDAITGDTRFYLRADADAFGKAWAEQSRGMILPPDSAPSALRRAPTPERELAIQDWALRHGPFGMASLPTGTSADAALMRPGVVWGPSGPVPQLTVGQELAPGAPRATGRVIALLRGSNEGGPVLTRWPDAAAPHGPTALGLSWERFASYERLQDSIGAAGGQMIASPVRYELGPRSALAVRIQYLVSRNGAPVVGWVELARGDRLGAARSPASAWANLNGESAPVVPAPDLPEPIAEARRWAVRADSALRAGDLQGFGRAFEALKRVLGTP